MRSGTFGRAACAVVCMSLASAASAAVAPYIEDFNDGAAADLGTYRYVTSGASTWTVDGGGYRHELLQPGSGTVQFAGSTTVVSGLVAPTDWKVEADVNVSDASSTWPASVCTVGLVGMARTTNVGQWNTDAIYYAGEVVVAGDNANTLRIRYGRGNNSVGTLAGTATTGGVVSLPVAFQLNTDYHMTLVGDYDASGDLWLTFSVGGTSITSPTPIAAASVSNGTRFGIRDYTDNYRNLTATYDNLSVGLVPEPTSAAVIGLLATGVLVRRRRA